MQGVQVGLPPPHVTTMGSLCMSGMLRPTLESIIHHYHSYSSGSNLATEYTYWQGKLGNVVSSLAVLCQLTFAGEERKIKYEGPFLCNISDVCSVLDRIQCYTVGG